MSNQELNDRIAAIQTQSRSLMMLIDSEKHKQNSLRQQIDALENQLSRCIRLPYLVASISEVRKSEFVNLLLGTSSPC